MDNFDRLVKWFTNNGDRVVVALSGGVDSAVVALAAKKALGNNAIAVTADYEALADEELATARKAAKEIGIEHRVIEYNELQNPDFVKNDEMRCYHCRTELGHHLVKEANKSGVNLIVDGTNLDDVTDYRPGIRAMRENGVRSPMVELGITKTEIRQIAKFFGLSIYDKPSNACLASRIPTGTEVTHEKLKRIEIAEYTAKKILAVRQLRVRDHADLARIEVGKDEFQKIFDVDKLGLLDETLRDLGFKFVSIDAAGYRSGKLKMIGND